jgi:cytochrome bd-type quinol oxidase subunit 2
VKVTGGRGTGILRSAALFLAAAWFGAMTFFAAGGARIVLDTSTSRHAAGAVNRALLDRLDLVSAVVAVLLLAAAIALGARGEISNSARGWAVRLALVAAAAAFASGLVITPRMWELRARMPMTIDLVPKDDPVRVAWGRLHGVSTLALLARVAAAAGLFAVLGSRPRPTVR